MEGTTRGDRRLQIAANLMEPRATDGAEALQRIRAMHPRDAGRLRGLVDWVEQYEQHEQQKLLVSAENQ